MMSDHQVTVPSGELDGMVVERFTVSDFQSAVSFIREGGRGVRAGEYTRLREGMCTWMSDTTAEWLDHWPATSRFSDPSVKRVLINGLGLGMVVQAALRYDHVEHVDVVEFDKRVIELVGPHYGADPRVTIINADAFRQTAYWSRNTHWNIAWHDIWPDLSVDNLPEMAKLHRSYGQRVDWQGSWGKEDLIRIRNRDRRHARDWE